MSKFFDFPYNELKILNEVRGIYRKMSVTQLLTEDDLIHTRYSSRQPVVLTKRIQQILNREIERKLR